MVKDPATAPAVDTAPEIPQTPLGAHSVSGGDGDALWAAFMTGQRWQICKGRYDWHDCQSAGHPIVRRGTDLESRTVGLCNCEDEASVDPPTLVDIAAGLDRLEAVWQERWAS